MNPAIAFNTFHRIFSRPLVVVLLCAHVLFGFTLLGMAHAGIDFDFNYWKVRQFIWIAYTWILGSGLVGRDFSDGILPLIFSRPVTRAEYVLSRWSGLVMAVGAVMLMDAVIGLLFLSKAQHGFDLAAFAGGLALSFWMVAASAALLTLFSCLVPSQGDLGLFFGGWMLLYVLTLMVDDRVLEKALARIFATVLVPGAGVFEADQLAGASFSFVYAGLQAAACLYVAVLVMKNKEITYVMAS